MTLDTIQTQLHQVQDAIRNLGADSGTAIAAVRDAEKALAEADVQFLLGGSVNAVGKAQEALADARAAADTHLRRRQALTDKEEQLKTELHQAQQAAKRERTDRAAETVQPELDRLGQAFLEAGIRYAAAYAVVNDIGAHLVDPGRLLAKLSIERPLPQLINERIQEIAQ
jgi:hypothetical protein